VAADSAKATAALSARIVGRQFGHWTVERVLDMVPATKRRPVLAVCVCGTRRELGWSTLRKGESTSCGCKPGWVPHNKDPNAPSHHPLYMLWRTMHARCSNPKADNFRFYGKRGIRVCERWGDFWAFIEDMGPRPSPGHSLDRIDSNGNYEPGNVRWAEKKVQARNTRSNRLLTLNGRTQCISAWSEETGLKIATIGARIRQGWPVEAALSKGLVGPYGSGRSGLGKRRFVSPRYASRGVTPLVEASSEDLEWARLAAEVAA